MGYILTLQEKKQKDGLITKINLTYHSSKVRGDGGAAAFRYYRYRIAPNPIDIDVIKFFELRYRKVAGAKLEMAGHINKDTIGNATILKASTTNLKWIPKESHDLLLVIVGFFCNFGL